MNVEERKQYRVFHNADACCCQRSGTKATVKLWTCVSVEETTYSYRILVWRPLEVGHSKDRWDRKINKDGCQGNGFWGWVFRTDSNFRSSNVDTCGLYCQTDNSYWLLHIFVHSTLEIIQHTTEKLQIVRFQTSKHVKVFLTVINNKLIRSHYLRQLYLDAAWKPHL